MKKTKLPLLELISLTVGEAVVSLIICAVYLIIDKYTYAVALGALLGSLITIFNFVLLFITANRALDKVMADRGEGEMTEEEAEQFALENKMRVQNAIKISYIARNVLMAATLVVAFLLPCFDVIAALIPLVMFRPILMLFAFIKSKREGGKK